MEDIKFTFKQLDILAVIKKGNKDGSSCSVYDILENLSYECKRDALLHSIKILVENGYVERRDKVKREDKGKPVRVFVITTKSLDFI